MPCRLGVDGGGGGCGLALDDRDQSQANLKENISPINKNLLSSLNLPSFPRRRGKELLIPQLKHSTAQRRALEITVPEGILTNGESHI